MNKEQNNMKLSDHDHKKTEIPQQMPGEWVKDLFAPVYDFDAIVAAGRNGSQNEDRKPLRVPILDPETIREVFERIHQRVVDAEKKQLQDMKESLEKEQNDKLDPRKSSIWNTDELDTLRKVYKLAKGEISKLEIALHEQTKHNNVLELTVAEQRGEIEQLKSKLGEATKANQRLSIHRDQLVKEKAILEVKVAALTDMWHDIEQKKVKAMEGEKAAHIELDNERLSRQKLEIELLEAKESLLHEIDKVEQNIRTKYEMEINDLHDIIKDLTVELHEEKKLHGASKRGLDHLRNHFSSLPLHHILAPNAVVENEVDHIDHCSL